MIDPTFRRDAELALQNDFSIGREIPQPAGITAFSAAAPTNGSRVEISLVPLSILGGPVSAGDLALGNVRLQHPNIQPIARSGVQGTSFYWIAEELDARTLRSRLARGGRIEMNDSLIILRDVAAALTHAHRSGVVHGGLSPDTVLLSGGSALIANLGVARVYAALNRQYGDAVILPEATGDSFRYSSPEQVGGAEPDARSDAYAWGVIAYELLAGRHPFAGRHTPREMLSAHATEAPPQLHSGRFVVPAGLTRLVMRCLSKEPAKRPQSGAEILDIVTKEMLVPPPAAPAGSGQKLAIALVVALGGAVAILALLGSG